MKQVTIENVKARIALLESTERACGLTLKGEFELACLRQLVAGMQQKPFMYGIADPDGNAHMDEMCVCQTPAGVEESVACLNEHNTDVGDALYQVVPLYRHPVNPGLEVYTIGDATMRHIFTPTGMTNVSNMQAVFDQVENVLAGMEQPGPVVTDADPSLNAMMRALDAFYADDEVPERAMLAAFKILLADVRNQAQEPATDNTAQQFEALATSKLQREAYEVVKFGTFKATEINTDNKREFKFSDFEFKCKDQTSTMHDVSVKKSLQAVINSLQEHCDGLDDEKFQTVLNSKVREANNDTENLG